MRIVDVTLPGVGGLSPSQIAFDHDVAPVELDRITREQLRAAFVNLFAGRLDARWTVRVDGVDHPVSRSLAERIGQTMASRGGVRTLTAAPVPNDDLTLLAVRTGLELQGRVEPRSTPALVASGMHRAEEREIRRREAHERRVIEAEHRRNQRAAALEEGKLGSAQDRERLAADLAAAESELRAVSGRDHEPDPLTLSAGYIFSLHERRNGDPDALTDTDRERLANALGVLCGGEDPLLALAEASLGPLADQLGHLVADASRPDPELGAVPLVLDRPFAGEDPTLVATTVRRALAGVQAPGQIIVLGPSPLPRALQLRRVATSS